METKKDKGTHKLKGCSSLVLCNCCAFLLDENKIKLKEAQLAWESLINVCKCGQISPRTHGCHDLQLGKAPLTIN